MSNLFDKDPGELTADEKLLLLKDMVERMRTYQKEYFKTRNFDVLQNARLQERKVDKLLNELK